MLVRTQLEDYECYALLQRLVDTAKAAGLTVARAADALTVPDFVFAGW